MTGINGDGFTAVLPGFNKKHWRKLKNIHEDAAHQISRQIVSFCKDNDVTVIILPRYSESFTRYVIFSQGGWSPVQLSIQIIQKLQYKAWKEGILLVEVEASNIAGMCAVCGSDICKEGKQFVCANGHRGNRYLNSARNLGKKFIKNMQNM